MSDIDDPIPIACPECTNQIKKTYDQLKASEALACPACGHNMTAARTAVLRHIETIRTAMAGVRSRRA
jgi:DNA-directed RNA polymerase subunit RPC12/RpoP